MKGVNKSVYLVAIILILTISLIYSIYLSRNPCAGDIRCSFIKAQQTKDPRFCQGLDELSKKNCIGLIPSYGNKIITNNFLTSNYLKSALAISILFLSYFAYKNFRSQNEFQNSL